MESGAYIGSWDLPIHQYFLLLRYQTRGQRPETRRSCAENVTVAGADAAVAGPDCQSWGAPETEGRRRRSAGAAGECDCVVGRVVKSWRARRRSLRDRETEGRRSSP